MNYNFKDDFFENESVKREISNEFRKSMEIAPHYLLKK
jgi:hypothetical protein